MPGLALESYACSTTAGSATLHSDTHLRNLLFVADSQIIPSGRIRIGRKCAKVTQVYWNVSRIPIGLYPNSCTFSLLTRSFHKSDMCHLRGNKMRIGSLAPYNANPAIILLLHEGAITWFPTQCEENPLKVRNKKTK